LFFKLSHLKEIVGFYASIISVQQSGKMNDSKLPSGVDILGKVYIDVGVYVSVDVSLSEDKIFLICLV
jgi:hypothetical protein